MKFWRLINKKIIGTSPISSATAVLAVSTWP